LRRAGTLFGIEGVGQVDIVHVEDITVLFIRDDEVREFKSIPIFYGW
jgi:hypothetical protein